MSNKKTLVVVVGPTAIGKTDLAIILARHFNTEIISADSRQFYKEMSVGTAKPSKEERSLAKHHFIDSLSIHEHYSAGEFERDSIQLLKSLFLTHDIVVMVGGSGLFVRAVCEGLDDLPKVPLAIRAELNEEYEKNGIAELKHRLKKIDPEYYVSADMANPKRVIRALEVYQTTGKKLSTYLKNKKESRPFNIVTIGLNTNREKLYERINLRVDKMIEDGLLKEVETLKDFRNHPALLTVGYSEIFDYFDGIYTLEEAIDRVKQNSRRYAKRQITWFKKYGNTIWFEPSEKENIIKFLEKRGILRT